MKVHESQVNLTGCRRVRVERRGPVGVGNDGFGCSRAAWFDVDGVVDEAVVGVGTGFKKRRFRHLTEPLSSLTRYERFLFCSWMTPNLVHFLEIGSWTVTRWPCSSAGRRSPLARASWCSLIVLILRSIAAWCSGVRRSRTRLRPSRTSRPNISWLGVSPEGRFGVLTWRRRAWHHSSGSIDFLPGFVRQWISFFSSLTEFSAIPFDCG